MIDDYAWPEDDFRKCYRDIERLNRYLGGTAVVRRCIGPYLSPKTTVLDVGTGSGDIPSALARHAERLGVNLIACGLDTNLKALRSSSRDRGTLPLVRASAMCLPFADDSFDVVTCSLTFHHFEDTEALKALREMVRVARRVAIVNDLRRGYLPAALVWILTRLARMHPLTRHDAPLSVMRSRTLDEYRRLARSAGFEKARVDAHPYWRASLVVEKR